jgi:hypothetical protein
MSRRTSDDPARAASPEDGPGRPFGDLSCTEQLDIAHTFCRQPAYRDAFIEALPESDGYDGWLKLTVDANVSDSEVGHAARALLGDELAEVLA